MKNLQNQKTIQRKADHNWGAGKNGVAIAPPKGTVQMAGGANAFLAGEESGWHVHYDHIKYGTNNSTRVNFGNKDRRKIGYDIEQTLNTPQLQSLKSKPGWAACMTWLRNNK